MLTISMAAETQLGAMCHSSWDVDSEILALSIGFEIDGHGLALECFLQGHADAELEISVAYGLLAELLSKELVEYVLETHATGSHVEIEMETTGESLLLSVESLMRIAAKLALIIILRSLLRIAEHVVGFVDPLEHGLGICIAFVEIRMMLLGQPTIG